MNFRIIGPLSAAALLAGCAATYQAPTPASVGGACWNDLRYTEVNRNTEGLPVYRACLSSKTEYGTPAKVQKKLERKTIRFCAQNGGHYRLLTVGSQPAVRQSKEMRERAARVELTFVCTKDASQATVIDRRAERRDAQTRNEKYEALRRLSELHESGALSDKEYEAERKALIGG